MHFDDGTIAPLCEPLDRFLSVSFVVVVRRSRTMPRTICVSALCAAAAVAAESKIGAGHRLGLVAPDGPDAGTGDAILASAAVPVVHVPGLLTVLLMADQRRHYYLNVVVGVGFRVGRPSAVFGAASLVARQSHLYYVNYACRDRP
jgi:hypothetical protein